jgi:hypothetical protein
VKYSCADWNDDLSDIVVAQRIIFVDDETAKVVLKITG